MELHLEVLTAITLTKTFKCMYGNAIYECYSLENNQILHFPSVFDPLATMSECNKKKFSAMWRPSACKASDLIVCHVIFDYRDDHADSWVQRWVWMLGLRGRSSSLPPLSLSPPPPPPPASSSCQTSCQGRSSPHWVPGQCLGTQADVFYETALWEKLLLIHSWWAVAVRAFLLSRREVVKNEWLCFMACDSVRMFEQLNFQDV